LNFDRAPSSVERLLTKEQLTADRAAKLSVSECLSCGFVQLTDQMPQNFYDDYEMALSFSPRFLNYLSELRDQFLKIFGQKTGRVLEIGCGDGSFLEAFQRKGFEVVGVEPSKPFRQSAQSKGLDVHNCYITADFPAPGGPYDAVVSRQVLEHVFDPRGFLSGFAKSLKSGGTGLVEVPSLEQSVGNGRYFDFFPDHVNYFSSFTLAKACSDAGLEVLDIHRTFNGEFLSAFVRHGAAANLADLSAVATNSKEDAIRFLEQEKLAGKRIAIWGAGGKGTSALAAMAWDGIAYVVDSDPRKLGLFLPVSHHLVRSPDHLLADPVDTVLITALAHRDEIIHDLVHQFKFAGTIATLGLRTEIVER
jgi:SAM-dependent methyltransferase